MRYCVRVDTLAFLCCCNHFQPIIKLIWHTSIIWVIETYKLLLDKFKISDHWHEEFFQVDDLLFKFSAEFYYTWQL